MDRQTGNLTGASGRLPSLAEAAREIVRASSHGALATLSTEGGYPYASLVELMPTDEGDVVMFLSRLAEHQHYLSADGRASVLIAPAMGEEHALARPRVTLVGHVEVVGTGQPSPTPTLRSTRTPAGTSTSPTSSSTVCTLSGSATSPASARWAGSRETFTGQRV